VAAAEARRSQGRLQLELVRLLRGRSERLRGEGEPVAAARELDRWGLGLEGLWGHGWAMRCPV
jgi:hypothetical protein